MSLGLSPEARAWKSLPQTKLVPDPTKAIVFKMTASLLLGPIRLEEGTFLSELSQAWLKLDPNHWAL